MISEQPAIRVSIPPPREALAMQSRMIFLAPNPDRSDYFEMPGKTFFDWVGGNTGNMAFIHAMNSHLLGHKTSYSDVKIPPAKWKEEYDILVYPAANHLSEKTDLGWIANLVEKSGLPILIAGLGAQANLDQDFVDLPAGTKRLLDILRSRGTEIGVRGHFTARVLEKHGFRNARVIGCPSNFLNSDPDLGKKIEMKFKAMPEHPAVALNLTYFSHEPGKIRSAVSWINDGGGSIVFQSDPDLLTFLRNGGDIDEKKAIYMSKYFTGSTDIQSFRRFLSRSGRVFSHIPTWIDYLRTIDISLGSRFHGNILAIQAGTPAVVFPHDSRTLELSLAIGIPTYDWSHISSETSLQTITKNIQFSAEDFDLRRMTLLREYLTIINQFNLEISERLRMLSAKLSDS